MNRSLYFFQKSAIFFILPVLLIDANSIFCQETSEDDFSLVRSYVIKAQEHFKRGQYRLALKMITKAHELAPTRDSITRQFELIKEKYTSFVEIHFLKARSAFETGDYDGAMKYLEILIEEAPDNPDVKRLFEKVEQELKERMEAIDKFVNYGVALPEKYLSKNEDSLKYRMLYMEARKALQENDIARALERLSVIYVENPGFLDARKLYKEVLEKKTLEEKLIRGKKALEKEDFETALKFFNEVAERKPEETEAVLLIARTERKIAGLTGDESRIKKAFRYYLLAAGLTGSNKESMLLLEEVADMLLEFGKKKEALFLYDRAAARLKGYAGKRGISAGDLQKNLRELASRIQKKAASIRFKLHLPYYLGALGLFSIFLFLFAGYLSLERSLMVDASALFLKGFSHLKNGRPETAFRYFMRSSRVPGDEPARFYSFVHMGLLKYKTSPLQAMEYCRAALSERPDSFHANYLLGLIAASSGRQDEAVRAFKRAIEVEIACQHIEPFLDEFVFSIEQENLKDNETYREWILLLNKLISGRSGRV